MVKKIIIMLVLTACASAYSFDQKKPSYSLDKKTIQYGDNGGAVWSGATINPYTNIKLTKVKRQMVFSAALMLLFSIGVNNIFNKIFIYVIIFFFLFYIFVIKKNIRVFIPLRVLIIVS